MEISVSRRYCKEPRELHMNKIKRFLAEGKAEIFEKGRRDKRDIKELLKALGESSFIFGISCHTICDQL